MITDLPVSSSVDLFEHLIEPALRLHRLTVLNISANGPSSTSAGEFNCFYVNGASLGNAGYAGTSAAGTL
jgi:hypothetical protein